MLAARHRRRRRSAARGSRATLRRKRGGGRGETAIVADLASKSRDRLFGRRCLVSSTPSAGSDQQPDLRAEQCAPCMRERRVGARLELRRSAAVHALVGARPHERRRSRYAALDVAAGDRPAGAARAPGRAGSRRRGHRRVLPRCRPAAARRSPARRSMLVVGTAELAPVARGLLEVVADDLVELDQLAARATRASRRSARAGRPASPSAAPS